MPNAFTTEDPRMYNTEPSAQKHPGIKKTKNVVCNRATERLTTTTNNVSERSRISRRIITIDIGR